MRTKLIVILVILAFLMTTTMDFANDGLRSIKIVAKDGEVLEPFGQSWAVVIGIDNYQNVGKLKFAVSDAEAVKQMLQDKYGFVEDHIFTLYDNKATKNDILKKIGDDLPDKIGDRDRLLIYFAGHGESSKDNGYLIPVDYRQGEYRASAISMTELKDILKDIKAKHIYMVLDACYSGMFFTTRAAAVKDDHPRYLQEITKRKARQALTAGGKEPVSDGGYKNHSAFTGTFLDALITGMADYNGDGIITASEINTYIQPKVAELADQIPEFGNLPGSEGGEFVFVQPSVYAMGNKPRADKPDVIEAKPHVPPKIIDIIKPTQGETQGENINSALVAYYPFNGNANDESGNRGYYIQSQNSGLYLDVYQANKEVGGKICQAVKHPDQVWRLEPSEKYPGYYYIQSRISGLYLDVYNGNKDVGGRICQAVKHPDQVWRLEPSEKYPGYYYIQSRISGLYLDVYNGNKDDGGRICQAVKHPDQVWKFE
ncbi:MAG: RICIN domain-containing protein [bacterium]|nr:RICIN domain-containing protein [bacterium]